MADDTLAREFRGLLRQIERRQALLPEVLRFEGLMLDIETHREHLGISGQQVARLRKILAEIKREHGIPPRAADRADSLAHWARSEAALGRGSGMPWRKTRRRCAFCLPVTSKLESPESKVCATCGGPIPG